MKKLFLFLVVLCGVFSGKLLSEAVFNPQAVRSALDAFKNKVSALDVVSISAKIKTLQDAVAAASNLAGAADAITDAQKKIAAAQTLLARIPTSNDIILLENAYSSYAQATTLATFAADFANAQTAAVGILKSIDAQALPLKTAQEAFRSSLSGVPLSAFLN